MSNTLNVKTHYLVYYKNKTFKNEWTVNEHGGFWNYSLYVHLESTYLYADNTVSVNQNVIITEKETKEYLIWDTVYSVQRLEQEVLPSGLVVHAKYADVCGNEYTDDSKTLCFILRKPN